MLIYSIISEATANDLFRKIDALTATINDRASSDSEKENAAKIKAKLELQLKDKFPGAVRTEPRSSSSANDDAFRKYADDATRSWDEYEEYQRVKNDPTADRSKYRAQIVRLRAERKRIAPARGIGDTEASARVKEIDNRIRRIYRDMFPEEWKELEAKRAKASSAARNRDWEKRVAKNTEKEKAAKTAGLSYKQASKMHPESLKALADALKHRYAPAKDILGYLTSAHTKKSDLKAALAKLSPEDVANIKKMVDSIHTNGYVENYPGYTERQKADILSAFAPTFDPNASPKTGQSWNDFKAEYEPLLAKTKYKRSKWEQDKSLFDIFGQSLNAYARNEIQDKISRNLSKEDRAKLVSALQGVAPANKIEQARVNKLVALLQ